MHSLGVGVAQVPYKPMHSGPFLEWLAMSNPIFRDLQRLLMGLGQRRAGIGANQFFVLIIDLKLNIGCRSRGQKVVENGSIRRILSCRNLGRHRRVLIFVPTHADCGTRRKENGLCRRRLGIDLAEWRNIIENPERASVGCRDQIVLLDREIVDGHNRRVQPQRLPMAAAVEGDVYALFGSGVDQTPSHRVFPYRPNEVSIANATHRFLPGLTEVMGLKNVRTQVVQRIPVDGDVGSTGVEVRRLIGELRSTPRPRTV